MVAAVVAAVSVLVVMIAARDARRQVRAPERSNEIAERSAAAAEASARTSEQSARAADDSTRSSAKDTGRRGAERSGGGDQQLLEAVLDLVAQADGGLDVVPHGVVVRGELVVPHLATFHVLASPSLCSTCPFGLR